MTNLIGVMQSRLTPTKNRGIQFYPSDKEIANEFLLAKDIGIDNVEWIIADTVKNSFFKDYKEICKLKNLIIYTGIEIKSVCLDYLIDLDLNNIENMNIPLFGWIMSFAEQLGCEKIIIPIYDRNMNMDNIYRLLHYCESTNLIILFEFLDTSSKKGLKFLDDLSHRVNCDIGVCFDIGNNCGLGVKYILEEILEYTLSGYLKHIHIKEKNFKNKTCNLGLGLIGTKGWIQIFKILFPRYSSNKYEGDFTLQVARGREGHEEDWVRSQIEFLEIIYKGI